MRKYLWVVALALVVSSISAESFAADSSLAQQDQAFLNSLAQQDQEPQKPVSPARVEAPPPALPAACINLHCGQDSDCWPHCGGVGASYCAHSFPRRCVPY